ncbi:MAG: hypothetical protein OXI64_00890 [Defluviicoccus sp.]|nr:hypothetical protein [Defluviicoccus sp.]
MVAAFDTLATARTLQAAGMGKGPAEAIAGIFRDAADAPSDDTATKADLAELKAELKAEFKADMLTLTWRMIGLAAVIVAAVKLIPGP